jgi:RNA polymerase sigma-70 factor, ECF subfamily
MASTDEHELLSRSLQGDHDAYGQLVDAYKNALYRHCFAIVRNEDVAEDVAQDTFITAYYKLDRYDTTYKFGTWLFKISTNKCLDWLRKNAKYTVLDDDMLASLQSNTPSPETEVEYTELRDAVEKLDPKFRTVISLYYWQGYSYRDIAAIMAAPEGTIKGWISRAKDRLREELA